MALAYEAPLSWKNVFPNYFVSATDPALDAGNNVTAWKTWIKVDAMPTPTEVLGRFVRNAANTAWLVEPGGSGGPGGAGVVRVITGDDTLTADDYTVFVDASGGPVDVTLPLAASVDGQTFFVAKIDNSANDVTILPSGTDEINGAASRVLNSEYEGTELRAYGAGDLWVVVARPGSGAAPEGAAGGDLEGNYPNPTITLAAKLAPIVTEAADFSLGLTHIGKRVLCTKATAQSVTVDPQATTAYPANAASVLINGGAGQVTVVAGAGVTIHTTETLALAEQWAVAELVRLASDEWLLTGRLEEAP